MTHITDKPIPKLPKAPQPPLSYPGATADSDCAKKPPLSEPFATDQELNPGDRVMGLGDSENRPEKSALLSNPTKTMQSLNGMMTAVRDSTNRRSRRSSPE